MCEGCNPDEIFKRFKVLEFPISYVGLSTTKELDVEVDLNKSAYLKTLYDGQLMKFDEARNMSASHRAFEINIKDDHTILITFTPKNECISKAKCFKHFDNRFVFDLRLIQVDGSRCCYNEFHSEFGRYYISGQFDYNKIDHSPEYINFGDVEMNTKVIKYLRIRNNSNILGAKLQYVRVTGFEVLPQEINLPPNSSKKLTIVVKPTCLNIKNTITFKIINPHDVFAHTVTTSAQRNESNYLIYAVNVKIKVICQKKSRELQIESLHKLHELNPEYTYINIELLTHAKRKALAYTYLETSKSLHAKKSIIPRHINGKEKCYYNSSIKANVSKTNFCKSIKDSISIYDLFDVRFQPYSLSFGKVALSTYGETILTINNNTKFEIDIELMRDKYILYTSDKKTNIKMKLKSFSVVNVALYCFGNREGLYKNTFEYVINQKFNRKHFYSLHVGNPTLMVLEKVLKFGMVTTETFVVSVPLKIYNDFNIPVDFQWEDLHSDTPFEIIPKQGSIPRRSFKICDILYICKATKTKTHEVNLVSLSKTKKVIPIELSVITRKLSIKFLQPAIVFKNIPLNLETVEKVKLENSSREIALFHVVEPLIPCLRIEPMSGIIRPKMIITFEIIAKIPCILEFSFDILVKINNKENVVLPISGNVIEPKIIIHPKNIYMSRIPCHMITYVPVTFQNISELKTVVEVVDTGDDNIFNVYVPKGNEKERIFEFVVEGGETKTVFIKVFDIFRREYEMYIPFKINGLLGPPNSNSNSLELRHYIGQYEKAYENNSKVKLKFLNRDINFCRISGVITVPWIKFSKQNFEMDYITNGDNTINFTMTNISKYFLYVTILTSKLSPNFTLDLNAKEDQFIINETHIKFELDCEKEVQFSITFHPKGHGRFVAVATLYLDKHMTVPYYNLTFIGKRQTPLMNSSLYRLIFPPCYVGQKINRTIELKMETQSDLESFSCNSKEENNLTVNIFDSSFLYENDNVYTIIKVNITVCCQTEYSRKITLNFWHCCGSSCDVEVSFCFTYCPLTLHANSFVNPEYPLFPLPTQDSFFEYMETCIKFLEKWMFQQGFRRDLYPVIPDTFHAISSSITSQTGGTKTKGINVSYLNFVRRIAGPLMKHIRKISVVGVDENFKWVKEIHDTYREVIYLLRARGANLWDLQAKFLLSYDQFVILSKYVTPKCNADIMMVQELLADDTLYKRLNKQSWFDFILQSYKVFIMDSCFFDCVCISTQPRNVVKVIVDWYNDNILRKHTKLRGKQNPVKTIANITTDLSDGIAIISTILNYCPFMEEHFALFCEIDHNCSEGAIIHNACLIIEAVNLLRLYFPLKSEDFLHPNFIQMLFFSVHLYVTLPMFNPRDTIEFNPPLLRSSSRQVVISPASQESLIFTYVILNNIKNSFLVEKASSLDNGKKIYLNIKFLANFVFQETAILLIHGYNKTRIFDTYIVFILKGHIGSLNPVRKCKVTGPLYRPNKVDILISSPFNAAGVYRLYISDQEPSIPIDFKDNTLQKFCIRRLNLIDKEIALSGLPKESGQEVQEHKLYLQIICLSSQMGNSWIWFRGELGDFFVKVTTQARWDLALDTLQAKVQTWPMDPCSCGEACECYRTTVLMIPHRNELMLKSLRFALIEHASEAMMQVFDRLVESTTGKIILGMLLEEGGTNLFDIQHILRSETTYRITSRALMPRVDRVTLSQHSGEILALPITVISQDKFEKYSLTLTSECGMDIRTYRIVFIEEEKE